MKHLIETTNSSSLTKVNYDRIILDTTTNNLIVGGYDANILMLSERGYQLYGELRYDGQINYWTFEYVGTEEYEGKEYFKYSRSDTNYILTPTKNITKVTFPFDDYYWYYYSEEDGFGETVPFSHKGYDSLYGFTSVPENKILMKRRTDIGTNANGKNYVDLGLTSGTLWATCNVGATSETDYGSYFQWGEIEPHSTGIPYDWANYKYGDGSSFSKYNTGLNGYGGTIDNKLTLDLEDDAARANMGGDWRMPTTALIEELMEETTNKWVNGYNGTDVNGMKLTSKINDNSIFIPAAGDCYDDSVSGVGTCGRIWSSSCSTQYPLTAFYLTSYSSYADVCAVNGGYRNWGRTVRGVL